MTPFQLSKGSAVSSGLITGSRPRGQRTLATSYPNAAYCACRPAAAACGEDVTRPVKTIAAKAKITNFFTGSLLVRIRITTDSLQLCALRKYRFIPLMLGGTQSQKLCDTVVTFINCSVRDRQTEDQADIKAACLLTEAMLFYGAPIVRINILHQFHFFF